jgi:hypothetical protein
LTVSDFFDLGQVAEQRGMALMPHLGSAGSFTGKDSALRAEFVVNWGYTWRLISITSNEFNCAKIILL